VIDRNMQEQRTAVNGSKTTPVNSWIGFALSGGSLPTVVLMGYAFLRFKNLFQQ
jgi:hypothetical protein